MTARALRRLEVPRFALECGAVLLDVTQVYHLDGALAPDRRNLVLVFHALTGSADAAGSDAGWWREVVGQGRAVDPARWAVLCPNLLGSCYGTRWGGVDWGPAVPDVATGAPPVTTRDQARLAARLVASLGVPLDAGALALVAGGSLGGMVALEWAAEYPDSARAAVALAAPASHPAWAVAWNHLQRAALDLAGPGREAEGLALARQIAMLSYRAPAEFDVRFGRARDAAGGAFAVEEYLTRHGARLVARFDPAAYRTLLGAMDAHDVGRGRGTVGAALRRFAGRLVGVGVPGDVLYEADVVRAWTAEAGADYRELHSNVGHDAFLVEHAQVGAILAEVLAEVAGPEGTGADITADAEEHAWAR
ncbi:homoserine O-acetyltransferase [Gemmatimonadetes bacterium T265]|nr:homoserine O-acetyltransferase [Gemmatimonadetes bacterium T265]